MAVAGPIARSAEDLGLLLGVLADAGGPVVSAGNPFAGTARQTLARFSGGAVAGDPALPVDDEVSTAILGPCKHCERRE